MTATEKRVTAKDVMTRRLIAVRPDMPLIDALRIMISAEVRHLPVLDGGLCRGLLTEANALALIAGRGPVLGSHVPAPMVRDACRGGAPSVASTAEVSDVARLLLAGGLDAVLVKNHEKVVGIITTTDLVRVIAS